MLRIALNEQVFHLGPCVKLRDVINRYVFEFVFHKHDAKQVLHMDQLLQCLRGERFAVERTEKWLFEQINHSGLQFDALLQRSDGWVAARKCRITASRFGVIAELSKHADAFALWQVLTGNIDMEDNQEGNMDIHRGVTQEQVAIRAYEAVFGVEVEPTGFFVYQKKNYEYLGASPDGLLPDRRGLIEVKCPARFGPLLISDEYMAQVQGQLEICNRDYCDFCTWHMNEGLRVTRISRSEDFW